MAQTLQAFAARCREILKAENNPAGRKKVCALLQDALKDEFLERIRHCDAVMFTGGNQLRLSATFGGTDFLDILLHRYQEEGLIELGKNKQLIIPSAKALTRALEYGSEWS